MGLGLVGGAKMNLLEASPNALNPKTALNPKISTGLKLPIAVFEVEKIVLAEPPLARPQASKRHASCKRNSNSWSLSWGGVEEQRGSFRLRPPSLLSPEVQQTKSAADETRQREDLRSGGRAQTGRASNRSSAGFSGGQSMKGRSL